MANPAPRKGELEALREKMEKQRANRRTAASEFAAFATAFTPAKGTKVNGAASRAAPAEAEENLSDSGVHLIPDMKKRLQQRRKLAREAREARSSMADELRQTTMRSVVELRDTTYLDPARLQEKLDEDEAEDAET